MLNASLPLKGDQVWGFFFLVKWNRNKQYFNFGSKSMRSLASFLIQIPDFFLSNSNFNELNSLQLKSEFI